MTEISAQQLSKLTASANSKIPSATPNAGGPSQEQLEQQQEMKRQMLSGILSPEARERLSRISLVKPDRARGVQEMLLKMFQSGQLRGKVSEEQLVDVLDQIEKMESGNGKGKAEEKGKITGISIVSTVSTTYPADSVEFFPDDPCHFIAATYQNNTTDPDKRKREGTLEVYRIYNNELILEQKVSDLPAILDLKWYPRKTDRPVVAAATSEGNLLLYHLDHGKLMQTQSIPVTSQDILCLSMDWSLHSSPSLITSLSDGQIAHVECDGSDYMTTTAWKAHDFEPWIVSWDKWTNSLLWSGGDDCSLKYWDIRQNHSPTWVNRKSFEAGVTSVQSHHLRENIFSVGSYDSYLRIFDKRNPHIPIFSLNTGGGVWRLKWHPTEPSIIAAACMHDGFKLISVSDTEAQVLEEWKHESMAYGIDWDSQGTSLLGCSFYDKKLTLTRILQ